MILAVERTEAHLVARPHAADVVDGELPSLELEAALLRLCSGITRAVGRVAEQRVAEAASKERRGSKEQGGEARSRACGCRRHVASPRALGVESELLPPPCLRLGVSVRLRLGVSVRSHLCGDWTLAGAAGAAARAGATRANAAAAVWLGNRRIHSAAHPHLFRRAASAEQPRGAATAAGAAAGGGSACELARGRLVVVEALGHREGRVRLQQRGDGQRDAGGLSREEETTQERCRWRAGKRVASVES